MLRRLVLVVILVGWLAGCAIDEFYRPYALRHPGTGATVTCGHWIWWECAVFDYERQGYQQLQEMP